MQGQLQNVNIHSNREVIDSLSDGFAGSRETLPKSGTRWVGQTWGQYRSDNQTEKHWSNSLILEVIDFFLTHLSKQKTVPHLNGCLL